MAPMKKTFTKETLEQVMLSTQGNVTKASKHLDCHPQTLMRNLEMNNLDADDFRQPNRVRDKKQEPVTIVKEVEVVREIDPPELVKLRRDRDQLEARKKELRSLEKELTKDSAWADLVIETLGISKPEIPWQAAKPSRSERLQHPIMVLSDIHHGEVVDPAAMNGMNEYDSEISLRRQQKFFESGVHLLKKHLVANYPGVVLAMLGDMIGGEIHLELLRTNDRDLPETIMELSASLEKGISYLADELGHVHCVCVVGNHGRTDMKPQMKRKVTRNYDWLIYSIIARSMRGDDRVTWSISKSSDQILRVANTDFLFTHGDQFRGGSGISGLLSPMMLGQHRKSKRQQSAGQPYKYMVMGHWHQLTLGMQSIIVNGSIKGYDEYAFDKNFDFEPPQQALLVVDERRGLTFRCPIVVE
jgi:transposase-like protein